MSKFSGERRKFLIHSAVVWSFFIPGLAFFSACTNTVSSTVIPGSNARPTPNPGTFGIAGQAIAGEAISGKVS